MLIAISSQQLLTMLFSSPLDCHQANVTPSAFRPDTRPPNG